MRRKSGILPTLVGDQRQNEAETAAKPWQPWLKLSLTNQVIFALILVLVFGVAILGNWINSRATLRILEATTDTAAIYLRNSLEPHVQTLARSQTLSDDDLGALADVSGSLRDHEQFLAVKIWRRDGSILYSSTALEATDHAPDEIQDALDGQVFGRLSDLEDEEHVTERDLGLRLYEIYAPLYETGTDRVLAVGEYYQDADYLAQALLSSARANWFGFAAFGALTILVMALIVRRASRMIQRQGDLLQLRMAQRAELYRANEELHRRIDVATQNAIRVDEMAKKRFGAELHDGAAQLVGFLLLRIDQLAAWVASLAPRDRDRAEELLGDLRDSATEALAEIRGVSAGLVAPHLDEGGDLHDTLQTVVTNHEMRTGTEVDTDIEAARLPLSDNAVRAIARIVQEALSNAFKHAAGVGQSLTATVSDGMLYVRVADAGPGLADTAPRDGEDARLGVLGMTFRAESLGGTCTLRTRSEGGAEVKCAIPLQTQ